MMKAIEYVARAPGTMLVASLSILLFVVPDLGKFVELHFQAWKWHDALSLFGCHGLHWSQDHLLWDLGVFVGLGWLCETSYPRRFLWTLGLSAVAISLGVRFWLPQLGTYRGLSGIDTALFGLLVTELFCQRCQDRDKVGAVGMAIMLIGMILKTGYEFLSGSTLFVGDQQFVPVPLAHAIGAVIGIVVGIVFRLTLWASPQVFVGRRQSLDLKSQSW